MTTTVLRQLCLVLVGALVFVKIDAFAIHSDETRGVDSIESHEFLPDATSPGVRPNGFINTQQFQAGGQLMARYSDEHDDFSMEQVRAIGAILGSAGQLAPTPTNNGPAAQVTGLQTPNIRNPVLIHSDERDFSDEVSLVRSILPNTQQSSQSIPMASTAAAGQEPIRGKRIFNKQPDERYIVSARPGKQVIIRPGSIPGSPIQTSTSIHKTTYRHSDEDYDYSDEVRSIYVPPVAQNNNAPANHAAGHSPTVNIPGSVYRLRSNVPASLPWREGEDDVQVQIDPVTKQVVNIRTEMRDSLEHDVYFSDVITSRIVASPTPVVSPVNTNGNVQPTPLDGRLLSALHSDELYDASYEVTVNLNQPNGQNLTAPVHFISRHSDEHDDSLETVRGIPIGQLRPSAVLPVQTAVNGERFIIGKHSDEDISLEDIDGAVRSGRTQLPMTSVLPKVTTGVEHFLRHSDEHDSSIELISSLGNLSPGNAQNPMVQAGVQGVQLIRKHSSELDDTSVEVLLVRNQTGSASGLHLVTEHDVSLEVVGPVFNPQHAGPNPAAAPTVQGLQVISRHSHEEDDDTSLEIQLIRNQTAPGQVARLLKHSDEHDDTSLEITGAILNLQNGQVAAEVAGPVQSQVIPGQHSLRHSDEVDDISLEVHHVTSAIAQPNIPVGGIVPAVTATDVQHRLLFPPDEHDVSLEDVIGRASGASIASQVGTIQTAPAQQGLPHFRNSDERDDLSMEVDISLLPEIQRLFTNVGIDGAPLPEVQTSPAAAVTVATTTAAPAAAAAVLMNQGNQPVTRMSRLLKPNVTLELREILANPVFQQKIQELDRRLKSAPDSRGKRLIEKYAEALALSSPSPHFNAAASTPSTVNSCLYLSLLITWVSLWLL